MDKHAKNIVLINDCGVSSRDCAKERRENRKKKNIRGHRISIVEDEIAIGV